LRLTNRNYVQGQLIPGRYEGILKKKGFNADGSRMSVVYSRVSTARVDNSFRLVTETKKVTVDEAHTGPGDDKQRASDFTLSGQQMDRLP